MKNIFSEKCFINCGSIRLFLFFGQKVKFFSEQKGCRKKKVSELGNICGEKEKWNNQECLWNMSTLGRAGFATEHYCQFCVGKDLFLGLFWSEEVQMKFSAGPFWHTHLMLCCWWAKHFLWSIFREEEVGSHSNGQIF